MEPSNCFRKQFVYGDIQVDSIQKEFTNWSKCRFADKTLLTHPDCDVTTVCKDSLEFVLIGFLLDYKNPSLTNSDIVSSIAASCHNKEDLFLKLHDLFGKYVFFAKFKIQL